MPSGFVRRPGLVFGQIYSLKIIIAKKQKNAVNKRIQNIARVFFNSDLRLPVNDI
jgi:hypothetical protein